MQVRPATVDDARAIATVHVRSWQHGYRGIVADEVLDRLTVDEHERRWRGRLADALSPITTLVTEPDVVGFVSLAEEARDEDLAPGTAEIAALYVDPGHWRAGVGTVLLRAALDRLRAGGRAGAVVLWVLEANDRGRAFYAAHGFRPDGARRESMAGPDEIRLRAPLSGGRTPAA